MKKYLLLLSIIFAGSALPSPAQKIIDYRRPYSGETLINGNVTALAKDIYGFVWLATSEELARFDGFAYHYLGGTINFDLFKNGNVIQDMVFTSGEELWVGSNNGLYRIDVRRHTLLEAEPFRNIRINSILPGKYGNLWVNTSCGIMVYCPETGTVLHRFPQPDNVPIGGFPVRTSLDVDSLQNLWFSFGNHLLRISAPDGVMNLDLNKPAGVRTDTLRRFDAPKRMLIDSKGVMWLWDRQTVTAERLPLEGKKPELLFRSQSIEAPALTPYGDDMLISNRGKGNLILKRNERGHFTEGEYIRIKDHYDDLSNTTNVFMEGAGGNLWLGTREGLFLLQGEQKSPFVNIRNEISSNSTLSHNTVSDIYIQDRNTAWIATAYGLNQMEFSGSAHGKHTITRFYDNRPGPNFIQQNKIEQIVSDGNGRLWLGTKGTVSFFDVNTKRFYNRPEIDRALDGNTFVRALHRDTDGNVWIGFEEGGLFVSPKGQEAVNRVRLPAQDSTLRNCTAIARDRNGYLWIGTKTSGIMRLLPDAALQTGTTKHYTPGNHHDNDVFSDMVASLYVDPYNNVWAGTADGLYKYDPDKDLFNEIPLPAVTRNHYVSSIIDDDRGNLWISTPTGIYKHNLSNGSFQYFELYGGGFCRRGFVFGSAKDSDGYLYLSGINGLTLFDPREAVADTARYDLFFTDFRIHNKSITVGSSILEQEINFTERIVLPHHDNQFSFAFSVLIFPEKENIQYSYMLEGLDPGWISAGPGKRYISYNNLPTGTYTLKIRSTNASGVWLDNTRSLVIRVKPYFLTAWYSCVVYVLLMCLLAWFLLRMWRLKVNFRTQSSINRQRLKFYTDVSYSIKTPLTLLQSPLRNMIDNFDDMSPGEIRYMLGIMDRNSNRITRLVDQLVQFRKLDQGKMPLHLVESDIVEFTEHVYYAFCELFAGKGIGFTFSADIRPVQMVFDPEKIETVLFNLLSNAYRFTPGGGKTELRCRFDTEENRLWIEVSDTGSGISEENREKVFERFWAGKPSDGERHAGTGIGLSLARELVELHHGILRMESAPGAGSTFGFCLPPGEDHFHGQEIERTGQQTAKPAFIGEYVESLEAGTETSSASTEPKSGSPLVYVVDEDGQILQFIGKMLGDGIRVETFTSAEGVFESALQNKPKLIISEMTFSGAVEGPGLCRRIKENPATNCIPFMFLTALSQAEDKQSGYESGADAYLLKPFDVKYLKMRIGHLLQSREVIRERIRQEIILSPREMQMLSANDKFLVKAMEVVEKNIAEENFSVDIFAEKMHLSTSMLYRKIKSLTDLSPNEFIKNVRLKRAAQLLNAKACTISEVAFKVGFTDIRYFSTCFKKEFGMTPSAYQQTGQSQNETTS